MSFLASSALYLLLAAACSPALPGAALLFASRLPAPLMHTLPGRALGCGGLGAGPRGRSSPQGVSLGPRARRDGGVIWGVACGGAGRGAKGGGAWPDPHRGQEGTCHSAPASPPAAQMVITDLSAPEERPTALGRLGLCFGMGTILGSLLGGTLSATCG